jgi:hypothetical protein
MQAKAIRCDINPRKRFFLLMIAPLLIGLMISLTTAARADWRAKDPLLNISPADQGWKAIKIYEPSPQKKDEKEKYISR